MSKTNESSHGDEHAERRRHDNEWRTEVDRRLNDGAETMQGLRDDLAENTRATKKIQSDTSELVELLKSFKGAFAVLEKLGKLARPLGYIAMAASAFVGFWAALKGGAGGGR
jgi:hypothetical protein